MSNGFSDVIGAPLDATLNGAYKKLYPEGIKKTLEMDNVYVVGKAPFKKQYKLGDDMKVPIIFQYPHNFHHAARGGMGAVTSRGDSNAVIKQITFDAYNSMHEVHVDIEAIFRAMSSNGAFKNLIDLYQGMNMEVCSWKEEEMLIYGGQPKGRFTSSANASSTSTVITSTSQHWSSIFYGKEGAFVSFFSNSDNSAVGQDQNVYKITNVNMTNETLTLTGSAADITDLDQFLATATDADCRFRETYANGSSVEFDGIDKCASATTGTLFGQDVTQYSVYKGNVSTINAAITFNALVDEVAQLRSRMLRGKLIALIPPLLWGRLMQDEAAFRKYDSSYKRKAENGFDELVFHTGAGELELVSHPYIKEGEILMFPEGALARGGAADWTDVDPTGGPAIIRDSSKVGVFKFLLFNNKFMYVEGNKLQWFKKIDGITG